MVWTATKYGWFSTTCARKSKSNEVDPDTVMIRARLRDHLVQLIKRFPDELAKATITETRNSDYRFRVVTEKVKFVSIMAGIAAEIDYGNFKSEVARHQGSAGRAYLAACHSVWHVMHGLQPRSGDDGSELPEHTRTTK